MPAQPHLYRIRSIGIAQLLKPHKCIRECILISACIFVKHLNRCSIAFGIHYELCKIWAAYLRYICSLESDRKSVV